LWEVAEPILEWIEDDAELRWIEGAPSGRVVRIEELGESRVDEWSDGSRMEGGAATKTKTEAQYLGTMVTVADAEALGISLPWESGDVVVLDSQGVIQRVRGLMFQEPRSWIEERLVRQIAGRPRVVMRVNGHSGIVGNEMADNRARSE